LFEEGQRADAIFMVKEGTVELRRSNRRRISDGMNFVNMEKRWSNLV